MLIPKTNGRHASVAKYDILTALGSTALAGSKHDQKLILRLITLITARYNWKRNLLAVGQREIARMWSVDERTVKREMAKLRARGWLQVRRQGARGHVTEYRIDTQKILEDTSPNWALVGPDFEARLNEQPTTDEKIVPLQARKAVPVPMVSDETEWSAARALLYAEDAAIYGNWFDSLQREERRGGVLTLKAPGRFHANYIQTHLEEKLLQACRQADPDIDTVYVMS